MNCKSAKNLDAVVNKEQNLIIKLENEGVNKIINHIKNHNLTGENVINIMKDGADEFKEKTGRNMTYSEIRQMYG
jgi:hypothetical protein